jgi:hypothetical protein
MSLLTSLSFSPVGARQREFQIGPGGLIQTGIPQRAFRKARGENLVDGAQWTA